MASVVKTAFCLLVTLVAAGADSQDSSSRVLLSSRKHQECDGDYDSLTAGVTCTTSWDKLTKGTHQLRPTEPAVGYAWVVAQMGNHFGSAKKSKKWLGKHTFPVVLGGTDFYLTDRHHHALAIQMTGDQGIFDLDITLSVVCDLRNASTDFWTQMEQNHYNLLIDRPRDSPFVLPSVVPASALPSGWSLTDFGDNMWRSLAGFSSHVDDDASRCYRKDCTYFVDYEWAYTFNKATEVDTSPWTDQASAANFKKIFEALPYRPNPKDVDLDAWNKVSEAVLPLCHSPALEGLALPSFFPDKVLSGWSATPVPDDADCPTSTCSGSVPARTVMPGKLVKEILSIV